MLRSNEPIDKFLQRRRSELRQLSRLPMFLRWSYGVSMNEHGPHTNVAPGFHVAQRIANHNAVTGVRGGKIAKSLLEQAGLRLAAVTFAVIVGANINGVEMAAMSGEALLKLVVYSRQLSHRVQSERHAPLVGHDNYLAPRSVQPRDGPRYARQQCKLFPASDERSGSRLAVDYPIPI
jgi:hypothetical protein